MKVKLKVIEFSSDIFSKSSQLKDIHISPLFSNTTFNINIFDAISKNSEYEIKVNTPIIKIGLFQGKSLLGIGEIDINKKSQNIKIASEQNSNQANNNKMQDNDYYIIIECINNNPINDKAKNINGKENKKKKKNSSVDSKAIYKLNNYKNSKYNKYKLNNSLKEYINNYSGDLLNKSNNKNYESRDDLIIKKKNLNHLDDNNNDDSMFNIKSNSTIMNDEQNKMVQNLFMSENVKSKGNDNTFNDIIFNESFQKDKFSDGVLILTDNKSKNENKINKNENFIQKMESIDIKDFNNLVNDFNLIYNNVNNNNSIGTNNLKDNFILEYQYFLEKTSDIFNLYTKLTFKINEQNINIKKYINRLNNDIQSLLKKDIILKLKKQKTSMIELSQSNYKEGQKYFNYEINNINNKLSLVKNINNDILSLTNNLKQNKYKNAFEIKDLFNIIINNEKIKEYLKIDEFFMKYMTKKSVTFKLDDINEKNEDEEKDENENENEKENEKQEKKEKENSFNNEEGKDTGKIKNNDIDNSINNNEKKIDIEILKNKIDKLKNQYLKETIPNEQKNKSNLNENNKKKKDREARSQKKNSSKHTVSNNRSIKNIHKLNKIKANDNSNIAELNTKDRRYKNLHNYYNIFTPSNNRRTKLMKNEI